MSGRRKALIVANDVYDHAGLERLLAPGADAQALATVLGDAQIGAFEVRVVRNEPAHVIQGEIEDLFAESRADDVLLLHFSCHGLKSESGELFFAARNTRPNRLGSTAVAADFVQRCMRSSRSRSIVLLLDCCYGGAFSRGVTVRAAGDVNVLDSFPGGRLGSGRGRAVITASSAMEYAFEGDQLADDQGRRPSVFTSALVEGLATGDADRDQDGWVSLNELYEYVFDRVREQNPHQTPTRDVEMQGELYLARRSRPVTAPASLPPELQGVIDHPLAHIRAGAVQELARLQRGGHAGLALAARLTLERLVDDDSRMVSAAAASALAAVEHDAGASAGAPAGAVPPPAVAVPRDPAVEAKWPGGDRTDTRGPAELPSMSLQRSLLALIRGKTGNSASTTELWDVNALRLRHRLEYSEPLEDVALDRDAKWLAASCAEDNKLVLWDAERGRLRHTLKLPHPPDGFCFAPEVAAIIAGGEGRDALTVWDLETGRLRHSLAHDGPIDNWRLSPDGVCVAALRKADHTVRLWDLSTGVVRCDLSLDPQVDWWNFSPDGQWIDAGGKDCETKLWDVASGRPGDAFFQGPLLHPEFSEDGGLVATQRAYAESGGIWLWDLKTRRLLRTLKLKEHAYDISFSPANDLLATGFYESEAKIWNVSTGRVIRSITAVSSFTGLKFSPDGKWLTAGCYSRSSVFVWDVSTGGLRYEIPFGDTKNSVFYDFSPDGRWLAGHAYGHDRLHVWNLATGADRTLSHREILSQEFSDDSRWLITLGDDVHKIWAL
ncbi:caspase family protein [Actinoplanes sp. NPDC051513]|uniref:caspase, EACC1-associated type n=1 Tax=Actinoplanes sp. NPDC051513 TaxID=3363908 RepID=UPI0037B55E7F